MFGAPPASLLSFEDRVLSNFRRNLDVEGGPVARGEDAQARIGRLLARDAHGLVLLRDNDHGERRSHGDRRTAIERGFAEAHAKGAVVPAVLALAVECIEAWALADPDAWQRVFGKVPTLPAAPESLWGDAWDLPSNHPKCVLRRCLESVGHGGAGNAVARLLEVASLERIAAQCPRGFGRFVADLRRAFPTIECVVAASNDRAIGRDGEPPWGFGTLRGHLAHLQTIIGAASETQRLAVIVGRKTWQHMASALRASPHRVDIVASRDPQLDVPAQMVRAASFDDALQHARTARVDRVIVLGGEAIYREALDHFRCTAIHYTRVDTESAGADTFFADLAGDVGWSADVTPSHHHDNGYDYRIERWSRFSSADQP